MILKLIAPVKCTSDHPDTVCHPIPAVGSGSDGLPHIKGDATCYAPESNNSMDYSLAATTGDCKYDTTGVKENRSDLTGASHGHGDWEEPL